MVTEKKVLLYTEEDGAAAAAADADADADAEKKALQKGQMRKIRMNHSG